MSTPAEQLGAIVNDLDFVPLVELQRAVGEVRGTPASLTILGDEPLSLLFGLRLRAGVDDAPFAITPPGDIPGNLATASIENGMAWLTLHEASSLNSNAIRLLVESVAAEIEALDLAVGAGCLRCGNVENAQLMYVESRPTRLCPGCLEEAAREREQLESHLNPARFTAILGLPAVVAYVAGGWALLWTLIDLGLEHWQIKVIEINHFTVAVFMLLLVGVGYGLGWPMGAAVRQSIAIRRAPGMMSVVIVIAAVCGGEIVYFALLILRIAGIFDLKLAAGLIGPVVAGYSAFWIVSKLAISASICFFSALAASERRTASLGV